MLSVPPEVSSISLPKPIVLAITCNVQLNNPEEMISHYFLDKVLLFILNVLQRSQSHPFFLLHLHFAPPESVLVEVTEGVDDDGYGKCQDEYS